MCGRPWGHRHYSAAGDLWRSATGRGHRDGTTRQLALHATLMMIDDALHNTALATNVYRYEPQWITFYLIMF